MNNNWIYFGVFLDNESREKLKQLSKRVVKNDWKLFCHHMTIAFNNGSSSVKEYYESFKNKFGSNVELIATHVGISDDAVCVKVECPFQTQTSFPHITIATPQGGKPVNSNYITNFKKLKNPIKLNGILNEFVKR
jgi:hypothetical protein